MSDAEKAFRRTVSYLRVVSALFYKVKLHRMPADRALRDYFAHNRQCGSRDRCIISNSLYAIFRWYGWIKDELPDQQPPEPIDSTDFCRAMALALWLDGEEQTAMLINTAKKCSLTIPAQREGLIKKAEIISELTGRDLTVEQLVPGWFKAELTLGDYEALQTRPPVWIRIRRQFIQEVLDEMAEKGIEYSQHEKILTAVKLIKRANLAGLKSYSAGFFEIQDLASQCLAAACDAKPAEKWLDICAGGGGKSLALADQMQGNGIIVASDKRDQILKETKRRARKAKAGLIQTRKLNAVHENSQQFDGVLVDAPCSCSGTWRRNPEARWIALDETCIRASETQTKILRQVADKVTPGGILVYATCSMSPVENEEVVIKFLAENPSFSLDPFTHPLTSEEISGEMLVKSFPDDCDTMYAARMVRKN